MIFLSSALFSVLSLKGLGIVEIEKNFEEAEAGALWGLSVLLELLSNNPFFFHIFTASLGSEVFVPSLLGEEDL